MWPRVRAGVRAVSCTREEISLGRDVLAIIPRMSEGRLDHLRRSGRGCLAQVTFGFLAQGREVSAEEALERSLITQGSTARFGSAGQRRSGHRDLQDAQGGLAARSFFIPTASPG